MPLIISISPTTLLMMIRGSHMTQKNDILKLIAMISMLIDHIGVLLLPDLTLLRLIERIVFPIFAYSLAMGFIHTSNKLRYAKRLLLFALISQAPYMFLNYGANMEPLHFNVIFFLLYGLGLLQLIHLAKAKWHEKRGLSVLLFSITIVLTVLQELLSVRFTDFAFSYNLYGFLLIFLFYFFHDNPQFLLLGYVLISLFSTVILQGSMLQSYSILGLMFIFYFSKKPFQLGLPKYAAYIFYPVHITLLLIIRYLTL